MIISDSTSAWPSSTTCGGSGGYIWRSWVDGTSTAAVTTASTAVHGNVWRFWLTNTAASTATTVTINSVVWNTWQSMPTSRIQHVRTAPPPPTAEQLAERRRIEEEARVAHLKAQEERKAAKRRARKLLVEHLTREQREQYEKHGHFDVMVQGKHYRIEQGSHGNVRLLDGKGHTVESYCVQPRGVPDEDAMLSQKLALELAPTEFFRKANVTRYPQRN